jgi:uncharacterized membrane protein HdeD (DUF308 family)
MDPSTYHQGTALLHNLAGRWWALAIRGVAALLFALLTLLKPGITLVFLVLLFGMYALADGVFNLVAAFGSPRHHWALLLEAIVSIVAGTLAFLRPGLTTFALLYLIACWAIFTGVLEIVTGFRLRKVVANEWAAILLGIASLLFGILILFAPGPAALAIVVWIGAYAMVFGIIMLVFAFRLRGIGRNLAAASGFPKAA